MPHGRLGLLLVLLLASACAAPASAAVSYPSGFEDQTLVSGLTLPMAVDWTPDGRTLVVDKLGRLSVVAAGGSTAQVVYDRSPFVNSSADRGLLGLAVDSDFVNNHYVYLLYTYDLKPLTPDSEDPMVSQLSRVELSANNTVSNETILLGRYTITHPTSTCPAVPANSTDCIPSNSTSHSIGTVLSDPVDGTLWVGSGDGQDFNTVDPEALRTYNEQSPSGKILHIDRNGNGLPGHAFCAGDSDLTHVCTKLYAKGFRNPFRFRFRPGGGLIVGDVGWGDREEIDLITSAGKNYGWPCYEGSIHTHGYDARPECSGPSGEYSKEGTANADVAPNFDYPHVGGSAVLGGPSYQGDQYPAGYHDAIFYGDYVTGVLKRLVPNGSGGLTSVDFASGLGYPDHTLVGLTEEPGTRNVVFVDSGDFTPGTGTVRRIVYSPGNLSPIPKLSAAPTYSAAVPVTVNFSAVGSSDPDGDQLSYAWEFGDGATGSGLTISHQYTVKGRYDAKLTVDDGRGKSTGTTVRIDVGNTPPSLTVTAPANYTDGQAVNLSASGSDVEDGGALPPSAFHWNVLLVHGDHVHPGASLDGASLSFFARVDHDANSHYIVDVRATDSTGLMTKKSVRIDPRTAPLKLLSSPAGAAISYGEKSYKAPYSGRAAIGFETSVSAGSTLTSMGDIWHFSSWSDGHSRLHDVAIPAAGLTLTARYTGPPGSPQVPGGVKNRGPRMSFNPKRGLDARRGILRGKVFDHDGVAKLYVALGRRSPSHKACRWWSKKFHRLGVTWLSCKQPRLIRATLVKRKGGGWLWRAWLGRRHIPAGRYRVVFRARDRKGNLSDGLSDGTKLVRVSVR